MANSAQTRCTAFEGFRRIASGELAPVALKAKKVIDKREHGPVLIFDDVTSEQIEVDFRGTAQDVRKRLAQPAREEGRPPLSPTQSRNGRAALDGRSWASSPAKSPCCRGTGTG